MAEGLSPSLPVRMDIIDGAYGINKTMSQMAAQNLRMGILTSPGERMMYPDFGVGIKSALFEPNTSSTTSTIRERIFSQVAKYLPYIKLADVNIYSTQESPNKVTISIRYYIPALNIVSDLTIPVTG